MRAIQRIKIRNLTRISFNVAATRMTSPCNFFEFLRVYTGFFGGGEKWQILSNHLFCAYVIDNLNFFFFFLLWPSEKSLKYAPVENDVLKRIMDFFLNNSVYCYIVVSITSTYNSMMYYRVRPEDTQRIRAE